MISRGNQGRHVERKRFVVSDPNVEGISPDREFITIPYQLRDSDSLPTTWKENGKDRESERVRRNEDA